jgi:transcriptional regulator with XRE-family HTH domain
MALKLKVLRLQAGLTLETLAQASELTRSYVSRLERGVSTPSIGAALKIAKALGVSVEAIFDESACDDVVVINRQSEASERNGHLPRVVSGLLPDHHMVAFVLTPSEKPLRNHPMSQHNGEEILYVLKGKVILRLSQREEVLNVGDCAHFNSSVPHKITSVGKSPASVLLVIAQK